MVSGHGRLTRERSVHAVDADHAGAVKAEVAQRPEHRIGGLVAHIELNRVTIRPTGSLGLHHQILDAGSGG